MNPWNSFLQTVFQFVKSLFGGVTKKMHRNAAVLTMGATLIAVIPFTAVDFQGGGKNAIVAYAETQGGSDEDSLEETEDTALPETDGNVLEDETTADEASSAETEADIEKETENTETNDKNSAEDAGTSEKADESNGAQDESAGPEVETAGNAGAGAVQAEAEAEDSPVTEVQAEAEETAAEEPAREVFTGYSDSDYDVLLRIVQAEAGNCDMEGRVMVANVILNRVENDSFPNTITKVVYQKHQFSPVSNGSIKRCRVTAETVEAVGRALSGEDLTDGALYFMNRHASSKKNASWFDRHLEFLFKHGNHEFFR